MNSPSKACLELRLACLEPHVSRRFRVLDIDPPVDLVLEEASPSPRHRSGVAEKFSLIFRGPVDVQLGQGLYRLAPQAADVEPLTLFLVPVASQHHAGRHYQAIVNREVGG